MLSPSRFAVVARVVLLPLALALGTVLGLGSYYEASDDASLAWLFSGVLARQPVPSVPLYFHGWSHLVAAAYAAVPGVAWFGALLGALLGAATVLAFAVVDKLLRPHLRPGPLALALVGFFVAAWLEHWLWFSYVRVGLLLAGAALLYAAQRPGRPGPLLLGLLGLLAGWLLRPSLGILAFGATLPALLLLGGHWRRALPLVAGAALVLGLATGTAAWLRTPAQARTQVRDGYYARILDFEQLRPAPRSAADSLGTAAVALWMLGDSTVVNPALCRRAYVFDAAGFVRHELPAKLWLRAGLLLRDYFPLVLALLATAALMARRRPAAPFFWPVQLGFAGALALLAGWLKLPPRLELPLLDFWLIANLAYLVNARAAGVPAGGPPRGVARPAGRRGRPGVAVAGLALLLYGAKTLHRRQVLGQERSAHERALAEISRRTAGHPRVVAGANDLLKSLSPFRAYGLGGGATLLLSGWPSHDASQAALYQHLTGVNTQAEGLRRLAASGANVRWVLSAETARWLNRRFRYCPGAGPAVRLRPGAPLAADTALRFYRPVPRVDTAPITR